MPSMDIKILEALLLGANDDMPWVLKELKSARDKIAKLEKVAEVAEAATSFRDWFYWTTDFEGLELCSVARQALEMVNDKLKPLDGVIKELGEK